MSKFLFAAALLLLPALSRAQATCIIGGTYTDGSGHIMYCTGTGTATQMTTTAELTTAIAGVTGGGIPAGLITLVTAGACPTGWVEAVALNGVMLRGTVAANNNVGQAGGSDTITPTIASLSAEGQVFAGTPFTGIINHTHSVAIVDPGHTHIQNSFAPRIINSGTAGTVGVQGASAASNASASNAATTATNQTATTGITASSSNPAGGVASITPAGLNAASAVTGTLNSFNNRPAYLNVIFCQKS